MKNVGLSLINFGPGCALPRSSIQLIHEVAFMPTQTTTSHGCVPCAGIALLQACFNCELTVWPVGFVESGGQRANSPDSPCHIYGYNINEIRDHYLMNYVGLISGGSVCKDGLLPPRFAPCSGRNASGVSRTAIMANGEQSHCTPKLLYPSRLSVLFYSILFVCAAFGILYLSLSLLQGCRRCRRFLRQTPSQRFTKTSKKQSLASSTIRKSSVLLPASSLHQNLCHSRHC